ncbi:hypothetical protein [Marinimicrobium agarilyticum]|uniref:hypothetical protein n=1 Tax=Marinimicrobium agarilyticum TaxID=306546 RepID=UPI00041CE3D2|nr:hypothetical protein [Marinimicrobium agarilyticum]
MNNRKFWRGFGLAFFYLCSPALSADTGWFAGVSTDAYSEPEPVSATVKDWGDNFQYGEHQWLTSEFTLGYRFASGLELSWQRRAQANTRINPEAADFYGRIQRNEPLPKGEPVPLTLTASSFAAHSLRVGYRHHWSDGWISAGISYLDTSHLVDGTLEGTISARTDTEYQIQANIDYVYYRDPVFNRPDINRASGRGAALDVQLHWLPSNQWQLEATAKDLLATVRWKDAPHTLGQADTGRKHIGEDGYARFNPLFTGREGYKDQYTQRIAPNIRTQVSRHWAPWQLHAVWQRRFDVNHWGLGTGYRLRGGAQLELTVWPNREGLELTWNQASWQLGLMADQSRWRDAHSLSVNLSYNLP